MGTDYTLKLVDPLVIGLNSAIEFNPMSFWFNLLVDSLVLQGLFVPNFLDHLAELLVFVENLLERALGLSIRVALLNATPGILGVDDSSVELRAHLITIL